MDDDHRLGDLCGLYDALWKDAWTMIEDLYRCISMYWTSGLWITIWGFNLTLFSIAGWYQLLRGNTSVFFYMLAIGGSIGGIFQLIAGPYLIYRYFQLKKHYPSLIIPPSRALVGRKPGPGQASGDRLDALKKIYDDLWKDARGLIVDINRNIALYGFSALMYLVYGLGFVLWAYFILAGMAGSFTTSERDFALFFTLIPGVIQLLVGLFALYWYFKLKKRYARLIQMEEGHRGPDDGAE